MSVCGRAPAVLGVKHRPGLASKLFYRGFRSGSKCSRSLSQFHPGCRSPAPQVVVPVLRLPTPACDPGGDALERYVWVPLQPLRTQRLVSYSFGIRRDYLTTPSFLRQTVNEKCQRSRGQSHSQIPQPWTHEWQQRMKTLWLTAPHPGRSCIRVEDQPDCL